MAQSFYSIPPRLLAAAAGAPRAPDMILAAPFIRAARPGGPEMLSARWRAEDGAELGPPVALGPVAVLPREHAAGGGRMAWTDTPKPPVLAVAPPEGAARLGLWLGGRFLGEVARAEVLAGARSLPEPRRERIGPADAGFVLPVFSERFTDWDDFAGHARELHRWILAQPPFDEEPARSGFAIDAFFWRSDDPETGLFDTPDSNCTSDRLFYGDQALAKQLLDPWIGAATVSVILINSGRRGGAGGAPGYSAWCSITPGGGEAWQAVCLHEVGHGFGLADEYLDPRLAFQWPDRFEPNVSNHAAPSQTPWSGLSTCDDTPSPSFGLAVQDGAPPGFVGTFQGARYREDLYRGARTCLMKETVQPFCAVCREHVRARF